MRLIVYLAVSLLLICQSLCWAENRPFLLNPKAIKNLDSLEIGESIRISIRTPEGLQAFNLKRVNGERFSSEHAKFYQGNHLRPLLNGNKRSGVAAIKDQEELLFNFSGRRTGRPYSLTVNLNENNVSSEKLSHVSTSFGLSCATLEHPEHLSATRSAFSDALVNPDPSAFRELTIIAEADYQFYKSFYNKSRNKRRAKQQTLNRMSSVFNSVDAIYSNQLGIRLKVEKLSLDNNRRHPYKSNVPEELLVEFRNYTLKAKKSEKPDAYHLFTGKALEDSVVGLAYVGATCRNDFGNFAFGLTRLTNPAVLPLITAHELAHNLGATHIDGPTSIMSPVLTSQKNIFLPQSHAQISSFISSFGACLASVE